MTVTQGRGGERDGERQPGNRGAAPILVLLPAEARMTTRDTSQMLGTRPADDLDGAALARWMRQAIDGFEGPLAYVRFAGGRRNRTYRIDTPERAYVLRRRPSDPQGPAVRPLDREFRLLQALQPTGFPAPRPLALCTDASVLGDPFYVMQLVEGRTLWDETIPGMTPAHRREHFDAWIDALAALHAIEPAPLALDAIGFTECQLDRKLRHWTARPAARATPELARIADWLLRALPDHAPPAIVHGDFRLQNLLFSQEGVDVAAVLDWDQAGLGDPRIDLAYVLARWVSGTELHPALDELAGPESGIPSADAMVARYCRASGRDAGAALDWHLAYTLFRLALLEQEEAPAHSATLAATAWTYARRAGA
ncbi:phosphotransferase family protein [Sphingomonas desiccabilis]|uniref:Phosphotransferase family protein n=1 Tax=Sphingomonas desiccabilis TaxID=429134 RepID=A0A4Q2IW96_9SPHN|nr:phosphotransferase family protein [Sphingomonas desiccabilis]MBB3910371.1 aminoglycoside phosphotransferase (APT) family kinase protein [Sphingomonas desiccabilis]RXZ35029.1 phosphotransferase family protein [Sphingomonas desiccabilis]